MLSREALSPTVKMLLAVAGALTVGVPAGSFAGRFALERSWASPFVVLSPDDAASASAKDADPSPAAGTRMIKPMPLQKARAAMKQLTAADPVIATVASIGADEKGFELHVVLHNRGTCKVTAARGVLYGFTPYGMPAPTNKHREPYVAFSFDKPIDPGRDGVATARLRYAEEATLAIAQIDATECDGAPSWKRP